MGLPNKLDAYDDLLMQRLHFTAADLDANRDGVMTREQKKHIWRWQLRWSAVMWSGAVFVAWLGQADPSMWRSDESRVLRLIIIAGLILGVFWFQRHIFRALTSGQVQVISGPIKRSTSYGKSNTYTISTSEREFTVSHDVHSIFCDGGDYSLYYLSGMDYLLSAVLHALPESTSPSFADLNPVLNRDVIDPQVPLLEQLNHLVDDQPAHSVAAELVISQTPVLRQINDLFSAKRGLRFETPKAKLRKKKGV